MGMTVNKTKVQKMFDSFTENTRMDLLYKRDIIILVGIALL